MIVAVVAVRVVQTAIDQIIEVIAVRHLLVSAALVLAAARRRGTMVRVGRAHGQSVLIVVAVVRRVQTAIVQVIDVVIVLDACVAAVLAVDVLVIVMDLVAHRTVLHRDRVCGMYRLSTYANYRPKPS
jgi:hypothetical protein